MTTWEQAKERKAKAEQMADQTCQMGYQTVMEFALFGQDLIELKAQCPWKGDGNFAARCEVEFPNDSQRSINDYMLLARHIPLLEQRKPDSQREALRFIKEQQPPKPKAIPSPLPGPQEEPKEQEMKKGSYSFREVIASVWPGYVNLSNDDSRAVKEALLSISPDILLAENVELLKTETRRYAIQFSKKFRENEEAEVKAMRDALPAKEQSKFEKAVMVQVDLIVADLRRQFDEQLVTERAKLQADRDEAYSLKQAAEAEHKAAIEYRLGVDSHMTMEEFQLVRNCLHPDRAPEGKRDRYTKAFDIFNRLEKTVNTRKPIAILRRNGWEKVSPFYKAA